LRACFPFKDQAKDDINTSCNATDEITAPKEAKEEEAAVNELAVFH